ncbi:hypothetical protein [Mesorhizobium sophorae]|uniref:hypothetical protein n=1 Tax=Mesorhizobium sophorae TaxID=1300294 RepID=UPI001FDA8349|nr:hypothetical protein [Mesorhizobium sophorae]
MFWNIIIAIASYALQILLTPKPQNAKPKSLEDFKAPTAEEGREIPVCFGTNDVADPNVTWYGDLKRDAIKGARRYGFFGPRQILGYKYSLGVQMGLCHGPADAIYNIYVSDKLAWEGASAGGRITINKSDLFGGDQSEGGIEGAVDIEMGAPTQLQNDYLIDQLGADVPAFRGVVTIVLRQVYLGTSNYIKPWAFRIQRIFLRSDGSEQWYPEKAGIGESSVFVPAVNQEVLAPEGTGTAQDIKNGYVVTAGTNLTCWKYPNFSAPLWVTEDVGGQGVTIDDLGHVYVSYQNGTHVDVYDITNGALLGSVSMGSLGNGAITCRTTPGSVTNVFFFEGATIYMASGSGASPLYIGSSPTGLGFITGSVTWSVSPTTIYIANNGFLVTSGTRRKITMIPWDGAGPGVATVVDLTADMFGDIVLVTPMEDTGSVLIIDEDSGIHLYNSDLSTRLIYKHGAEENDWNLGAQGIGSIRLSAGDDLIAFRADGAGGDYVGNVIVKYRPSDLTRVSIVDASDIPYFNHNNTAYNSSAVDPDNDYILIKGLETAPLVAWSLPPSAALDMNPAHIIRECLTNSEWGMGFNDSDIDAISNHWTGTHT